MIEVTREPEGLGPPYEGCVFCKAPTPYWTANDVACCIGCSKTKSEEDLPSKAEWVRKTPVAEERL